jgi:RNA-binding protein 39
MTPPEVRLAREKERELKELERATRTVFAFNLNIKADERDIFEFFAKAGEVRAAPIGVVLRVLLVGI